MHSSPSPAAAPLLSIASVYFYSFADGLFLNDLLCVSVYKFIDRVSTCVRDYISSVNSPMRDWLQRADSPERWLPPTRMASTCWQASIGRVPGCSANCSWRARKGCPRCTTAPPCSPSLVSWTQENPPLAKIYCLHFHNALTFHNGWLKERVLFTYTHTPLEWFMHTK